MDEAEFNTHWSRFCGVWRQLSGKSVPSNAANRWKELVTQYGFKAVVKYLRRLKEVKYSDKAIMPGGSEVERELKNNEEAKTAELVSKPDIYAKPVDLVAIRKGWDAARAALESINNEALAGNRARFDAFWAWLEAKHPAWMIKHLGNVWERDGVNSPTLQAAANEFLQNVNVYKD